MNIFVAKLNFDTRESDLQNAFEAHGAVDSVKIIMDKFIINTELNTGS